MRIGDMVVVVVVPMVVLLYVGVAEKIEEVRLPFADRGCVGPLLHSLQAPSYLFFSFLFFLD